MKNKLYKFKICIWFKDGTTTSMITYDDNINGENVLLITDDCYVITKLNEKLEGVAGSFFPINNNIKEVSVIHKEIK